MSSVFVSSFFEEVDTSADIPEINSFLEQVGSYNTYISSNFISPSLPTALILVAVPVATSSLFFDMM